MPKYLINIPGEEVLIPYGSKLETKGKLVVPIMFLIMHAAIGNLKLTSSEDSLTNDMFEQVLMDPEFKMVAKQVRNGELTFGSEWRIPWFWAFDLSEKKYYRYFFDGGNSRSSRDPIHFFISPMTHLLNDVFVKIANTVVVDYNGEDEMIIPLYTKCLGQWRFFHEETPTYQDERDYNDFYARVFLSKSAVRLKRRVVLNKSFKSMFGSTKSVDKSASVSIDYEL